MKTSAKLGAVAALGLIAVLTPVPASAASVVELGRMPNTGRSGVPTSINDHDVVVGYGNAGNGIHAVRWNARYYVTDLGALPGDNYSAAKAINNNNVAVGESAGSAGQRAVRWAADGTITALPGLAGAKYCTATDINDHGVIVGHCGSSTSTVAGHAVRWDTDGSVTQLGLLPGGSAAYASGVNAEGRIVGWATAADGGLDAVTWFGNTPTALATLPGGVVSRATGVNDNGMIVGYNRILDTGVDRAVYWNADGQVTELGGLPDAPGKDGQARAVNEGGIAVGVAASSTDRYAPAFWEFSPAVALPYEPVPGGMSIAVAINNSNVVVGSAGNKAVQWRI